MEILRHGKDADLVEVRCKCSLCGCEFKYSVHDIRFEGCCNYVECPDCGYKMKANIENFE